MTTGDKDQLFILFVPLFALSLLSKIVTEQKTAIVQMSRTVEVVQASEPSFTQYHCPPRQARNPVEAEKAEFCFS